MLLDPGSGCASPLSIDGIAFGVGTWSTSRISTVQVGQTVLDCYSMEVKPTIQMTKKLEQRFLKLDNEVCTCVGFYEDDYSSDEDMS